MVKTWCEIFASSVAIQSLFLEHTPFAGRISGGIPMALFDVPDFVLFMPGGFIYEKSSNYRNYWPGWRLLS